MPPCSRNSEGFTKFKVSYALSERVHFSGNKRSRLKQSLASFPSVTSLAFTLFSGLSSEIEIASEIERSQRIRSHPEQSVQGKSGLCVPQRLCVEDSSGAGAGRVYTSFIPVSRALLVHVAQQLTYINTQKGQKQQDVDTTHPRTHL